MASAIVVFLYLLYAIGAWVPALSEATYWVTNAVPGYREGILENLQAILWLVAAGAFALLAARAVRRRWDADAAEHGRARRILAGSVLWPALFSVACFLSFGEETSWGQHVGFVSADETAQRINWQGEVNVHNLNFAEALGLPADHVLYPYLADLHAVFNPLFYLAWLFAIVLIPFVIRRGFLVDSLFRGYPLPSVALSVFFLVNVIVYAVVDDFLFDVAELFEFVIALAAVMMPLDVLLPDGEASAEQPVPV